MIVTDQDLRMRSAIGEVFVSTRHRWCMWHIMYKLATKVPNRLLKDGNFKREFNVCVWSDLLEPNEFEEMWNGKTERHGLEDVEWFDTMFGFRQHWIPAYFRDFPLGSIIRTTSISESENSFYKNFLKPCSNIVKFYLNFNYALKFQWNANAKLDYEDSTALPILATVLSFKKHALILYTDSMFKRVQEEIVEGCFKCRTVALSSIETVDSYKLGDNYRNSYVVTHDKTNESYACECKLFRRQGYLCSHIFFVLKNNELKRIPEKYCESRWMKTSLSKAVHGEFDNTLPTSSIVDERLIVSNQAIGMFYGFLRWLDTDIEVLRAFISGVKDVSDSLQSGRPSTSVSEKRRMVVEFYGMVRPQVVDVHPPDVVKTKGSGCDSTSRIISQREKAMKEANKPLRRCKACDEMGHHDLRNYPMLKEMENDKEKCKGKRKY